MSKIWDDAERHFMQMCIVNYGCGREILQDLMGRQYGQTYLQANPRRGPYTAQRLWDEHTQRFGKGKPVALNQYIYQQILPKRQPPPAFTVHDITVLRPGLDTDIRRHAATITGNNLMTGAPLRQIILGGGGRAAYYAHGPPPSGPLAPGTTLVTIPQTVSSHTQQPAVQGNSSAAASSLTPANTTVAWVQQVSQQDTAPPSAGGLTLGTTLSNAPRLAANLSAAVQTPFSTSIPSSAAVSTHTSTATPSGFQALAGVSNKRKVELESDGVSHKRRKTMFQNHESEEDVDDGSTSGHPFASLRQRQAPSATATREEKDDFEADGSLTEIEVAREGQILLPVIHRDGLRYGKSNPLLERSVARGHRVVQYRTVSSKSSPTSTDETISIVDDSMGRDPFARNECDDVQDDSAVPVAKPYIHAGLHTSEFDGVWYFFTLPTEDVGGGSQPPKLTEEKELKFLVDEEDRLVHCKVCVPESCAVCKGERVVAGVWTWE